MIDKININYQDLKVFSCTLLSLITIPEMSMPFIKDILGIVVSILAATYSAVRIYFEIKNNRNKHKNNEISNREVQDTDSKG